MWYIPSENQRVTEEIDMNEATDLLDATSGKVGIITTSNNGLSFIVDSTTPYIEYHCTSDFWVCGMREEVDWNVRPADGTTDISNVVLLGTYIRYAIMQEKNPSNHVNAEGDIYLTNGMTGRGSGSGSEAFTYTETTIGDGSIGWQRQSFDYRIMNSEVNGIEEGIHKSFQFQAGHTYYIYPVVGYNGVKNGVPDVTGSSLSELMYSDINIKVAILCQNTSVPTYDGGGGVIEPITFNFTKFTIDGPLYYVPDLDSTSLEFTSTYSIGGEYELNDRNFNNFSIESSIEGITLRSNYHDIGITAFNGYLNVDFQQIQIEPNETVPVDITLHFQDTENNLNDQIKDNFEIKHISLSDWKVYNESTNSIVIEVDYGTPIESVEKQVTISFDIDGGDIFMGSSYNIREWLKLNDTYTTKNNLTSLTTIYINSSIYDYSFGKNTITYKMIFNSGGNINEGETGNIVFHVPTYRGDELLFTVPTSIIVNEEKQSFTLDSIEISPMEIEYVASEEGSQMCNITIHTTSTGGYTPILDNLRIVNWDDSAMEIYDSMVTHIYGIYSPIYSAENNTITGQVNVGWEVHEGRGGDYQVRCLFQYSDNSFEEFEDDITSQCWTPWITMKEKIQYNYIYIPEEQVFSTYDQNLAEFGKVFSNYQDHLILNLDNAEFTNTYVTGEQPFIDTPDDIYIPWELTIPENNWDKYAHALAFVHIIKIYNLEETSLNSIADGDCSDLITDCSFLDLEVNTYNEDTTKYRYFTHIYSEKPSETPLNHIIEANKENGVITITIQLWGACQISLTKIQSNTQYYLRNSDNQIYLDPNKVTTQDLEKCTFSITTKWCVISNYISN